MRSKGATQNHLLPARSVEPTDALTASVKALQTRLLADVCSIFLLEADRSHLVLAATVGLREDSVGKVRMDMREGLAGMVAEELRPISVADVQKHPRFKYFSEAGEDSFHGFLGVPVVARGLLQGVLVVQTTKRRAFSDADITSLLHAAEEISPTVWEVRKRDQFIAPLQRRLWSLALNLWWSWDDSCVSLFRDLNPSRWRELGRNPVALLSEMPLDVIDQRVRELVLSSRINHAYRRLQEYLEGKSTWGETHTGMLQRPPCGLLLGRVRDSRIVADLLWGGSGCWRATISRAPPISTYRLLGSGSSTVRGYFRQRLDATGWQQEDYTDVDLTNLPLEPALGADGQPIAPEIETGSGVLHSRVWRAAVGRRTLLLLDSDVEGNTPDDRELTARLYGGDERVRIRQELLLGIGGVKALRALGIVPGVLHLNEGHSAFAVLELVRQRVEDEGIEFEHALRRVSRRTVFTTHTPVPAGHDRFAPDLVEQNLGPMRQSLGISEQRLMSLGRVDPDDANEEFCMTVLGLKAARRANAVSSLHGEASRHMWTGLWGDRPEEEVPIGTSPTAFTYPAGSRRRCISFTTGICRPNGPNRAARRKSGRASRTSAIPSSGKHNVALKIRLLDFVRRRIAQEAEQRREPADVMDQLRNALSPDALTIGFARRYATYKRATLLFQDANRLAELVNDPQRPIQLCLRGRPIPGMSPPSACSSVFTSSAGTRGSWARLPS